MTTAAPAAPGRPAPALTRAAYLLRSSLDTDLANAYGINPGVRAVGLAGAYPAVTFHKPRVSDGTHIGYPGTVMTVPDVPHDNDVAPYAMAVEAGATPA